MILTLGDSFTVKRFKGDKPWPEHLAETLGKELMNISHEGETNHYIFRNAIWALNQENNISLVVLSLSNWDRLEVPYNNYGENKIGLYEQTKNYKPKILKNDTWSNLYKKHYSLPYYVDCTSSYILSIQEICNFRNIPLVIIQPVVPFHPSSEKYFRGNYDEYVDEKSNLKYINKNILCQCNFNSQTLIYAEKTGQLWTKFTRFYPENVMGNHDKMGDEFVDKWDGHPNQKGHKMISNYIINHLDKYKINEPEDFIYK